MDGDKLGGGQMGRRTRVMGGAKGRGQSGARKGKGVGRPTLFRLKLGCRFILIEEKLCFASSALTS